MDAIKKKMQAMKVEKDNACDRVDVCEEACKAARIRASKGEDEVEELQSKARQLETELDLTAEKFAIVSLQLEEKEKSLANAELEMNSLNRRVSGLEEDLEKTEGKMVQAVAKLDKATTAADDSERAKKVFQNKAEEDDKRIAALEKDLKEARDKAEAADTQYDVVAKKLATCDGDLEKAEERADVGETKILELEEELKVVANNLRSLEVGEEKANQREKTYKEQIKSLTAKLKQAEARAEFADKSVLKLQKEVDRLEDELVNEQEKFKAITEELEQTFAEMSGY
jgi:tropomyosin-1